MQGKDLVTDHNSSLLLKPSPNLELLLKKFNSVSLENNNGPENICSSKYYDFDEMHHIKISHKKKSLFLLHITACFLNKNFYDLWHHFSCTKKTLA